MKLKLKIGRTYKFRVLLSHLYSEKEYFQNIKNLQYSSNLIEINPKLPKMFEELLHIYPNYIALLEEQILKNQSDRLLPILNTLKDKIFDEIYENHISILLKNQVDQNNLTKLLIEKIVEYNELFMVFIFLIFFLHFIFYFYFIFYSFFFF